MKKYIAAGMLLFMTAILTAAASAETVAEGTCGENLTWVLEDTGTLTISGDGEMDDYSYDSSPWYSRRHKIIDVVFDGNLTSIGNYAFSNCDGLTSVEFPESLTSIGSWAFGDCNGLTSVEFPESLTSIGDYAFSLCDGLISVAFPESLTSIGVRAFSDCDGLTEITIRSDFSAGYNWLSNTPIQKLVIADTVTQIPDGLLYSSTLSEIIVEDIDGDGYVSIDNVLYTYDSYLETYTLVRYPPAAEGSSYTVIDGTGSIADRAFENCDLLESIEISGSVKSIGQYAFSDCDVLSEIIWGKAVDKTGGSLFSGSPVTRMVIPEDSLMMPSAATVLDYEVLDEDGNGYRDIDGVLFFYDSEKDTLTLKNYPAGRTDTEYVLPSGTDSIGYSAFANRDSLEKVVLNEGLISIGSNAFYGCDNLYDIQFPFSLKTLGSYAFAYCISLEKVELNEGLTRIAYGCFYDCSALKEIVLPETLQRIENNAFYNCTYLKEISIPASVTYIDREAFSGCTALKCAYFYGNAPSSFYSDVFYNTNAAFTIYFLEGTDGWTTPTWNGYPTTTFVPAERFVTGLSAPTDVTVKDTLYVDVSVNLAHSGAELCFEIPKGYQFVEEKSTLHGASVSVSGTRLFLTDSVGQPAETQYTLAFIVYSPGSADLYLTSAQYVGEDGGMQRSILLPSKITVKAAELYHKVILPDIFTGKNTVQDEKEYTFYLPDDSMYYDYSEIFASIDGVNVYVNDNGDNSFTVEYVTGELVITGTRTPKEGTFAIDEGTCGPNLTWSIDNQGVLTISGDGEMYDFEEVYYIPWKQHLGSIRKAVVHEGVTSIGGMAFCQCTAMTEIQLPESLTSIHFSAFDSCYALQEITLPDAIESIAYGAFCNCSSLTRIVFPENLLWLGDSACSGCSSLKEIVFGEKIESIGNYAFNKCTALQNFVLPDSITDIGSCAFYGCSSLTEVILPRYLTELSSLAFGYCTSLESIGFPQYITRYAWDTFQNCPSLHILVLNNTPEFDIYLFDYLNLAIDKIILTNEVTELPEDFLRLESIQEYQVTDTDGIGFFSVDGVLYSYDTYLEANTLVRYPAARQGSAYTILENTETIGTYAFYKSFVEHVVFAESVMTIEDQAFYNCRHLQSITVGKMTHTVSYSAFSQSSIRTIIIPEETVAIADEILSISSLREFVVSGENAAGYRMIDGVLYRYDTEKGLLLLRCPRNSNITKYTVAAGTTQIGPEAFSDCTSLEEVIMSTGVTVIENQAFSRCTNLKKVVLSQSLREISFGAFMECRYLKEISFPPNVRHLMSNAFYGCTALKSAYFYGDAPINAERAFEGTHYSFTVYYRAGTSGWTTPYWNGYPTAVFTDKTDNIGDDNLSEFKKYFSGYYSPNKLPSLPDVDQDGKITRRDAMILSRYLAGWDGYDKYFE
ncbi:MAG: leucine-rich repeat protein [Clostridia bacterium]|nr:leucine-rich repeat protein [Clostridia bacterium]